MTPNLCSRCGGPTEAPHAARCNRCADQLRDESGYVTTTAAVVADRYAGRLLNLADIAAELAKPPTPTPWRVHGFVADETLTILSSESGIGKSWLAQALCTGVAEGATVAELDCTLGTALYVDAEMGRKMFIHNRLRAAGVVAPTFEYVDAMGLDISRPDDIAWLERTIRNVAANFVVYDSLRRLTPSKAENDSDDMAPVIGSLAKVARDTGAAILLIHHKGDGDKAFRGSTAIRDQADALFLLTPEAGSDVLRLTCRDQSCKPTRYAKPPEDVFLKIDPDAGGISGAERPTQADRALAAAPERQKIKDTILAALPVKTQAEAARACDFKAGSRHIQERMERAGGGRRDTSMRRAENVAGRQPLSRGSGVPAIFGGSDGFGAGSMSDLGRSFLSQLDDEDREAFRDWLGPAVPPPALGLVPNVEPRRMLTAVDASDCVGVHVETIRRAVRAGALRAVRAGRSVRIDPDDLAAWLTTSHAVGAAEELPRRRHGRSRSPMTDALSRLDNAASKR